MTSKANDLTERLRRRLETERRAIEELTASELDRLGANSQAHREQRAAIPSSAIRRQRPGGCARCCSSAWLRPLVVGLSLWLGICGGSWATMHWLWARIQIRIETAVARSTWTSRRPRQTLVRLEETTWGIALREIEGERFVVLPTGALAYPPWTVDTRPAVKLSSE